MKLLSVSPLPPAPTGVAEFAWTVGNRLRSFAEVRFAEAADRATLAAADARLYHVGNNRLHAGAYEAALAAPGVVELHDAVLNHFLINHLDREAYLNEFVLNGDEWLRARAESLWARRSRCSVDEEFFRYPLLRRVVSGAARIIVHNLAARRLALEAEPGADIREIPHYVDPPKRFEAGEVRAIRDRLGVPKAGVLIAGFGYHRPAKRLRSALRAIRRLNARRCRLLICGDFVSPDYEASLATALEDPRVIRLPHRPEPEFSLLIAATDVCVNLRRPTVGESSGIAMKAMAAGKPVVVSDTEEYADWPPGSLVKIDGGDAEEEMLAAVLERLAEDAALRRTIGEAAAERVHREHSLDAVIPLYVEALGLERG